MIDRLVVYLLIAGCLLFASLIVAELNGGSAADADMTEVPARLTLRCDAASTAS
jgi:hypothetical protein